jgi:ketosteroid isomerase-like protein
MKIKTLASILFVSFLVFISCTPKTLENKDQALADSLLQVNINAWNSGNTQTIADMYTEDCLYSDNGKNIWTKDSLVAVVKHIVPAIKNFNAIIGPTTVTSDIIFMQKYWTLDYVAGESPLKTRGLSIIIWMKQADNSWKIVMEKSDYSIKTY